MKSALVMNEFSLIDVFFKTPALQRDDVIYGIGDDAACLQVPPGKQLFVSTDTLVADVHFLSSWDPFDIAFRAVMVNVSDIAAMAAIPCWVSLALTIPDADFTWLTRFSEGLHAALSPFGISLIGGDTTRGPLSITLTIHGMAPHGKGVRRKGAMPGDIIWVSGELGAAALAVSFLERPDMAETDRLVLMKKLLHPQARIDLAVMLQRFATAAIDISDGLAADLNHICEASGVGACLSLAAIPVHPLVIKYLGDNATDFSIGGGDDYELCFTTPASLYNDVVETLNEDGLFCYSVGVIEEVPGLRGADSRGDVIVLAPRGFSHF